MFLKDLQVANSSLYELRADEISRVMPSFPVCGENAATKKFFPVVVELDSFSLLSC